MSTVKLMSDEQANSNAIVRAVFDDIRAIHNFDFINNFWRALAYDAVGLKRSWEVQAFQPI